MSTQRAGLQQPRMSLSAMSTRPDQRRARSFRVMEVVVIALVIGTLGCAGKQIVERADGAITTDVQARLDADATANPLEIAVDTKDGVVSLTGNVAGYSDRDLVERIARDTEGVRSVDNNVRIGTP